MSEEWKEKNRKHKRAYSKRIRELILQRYGSRCTCCGETEVKFLTIDHVERDGAEHRRKVAKNLYYKSIALDVDVKRYRILCFNCNCGREKNGGICPHEEASDKFGDLTLALESIEEKVS